jgi:hypothetical protein
VKIGRWSSRWRVFEMAVGAWALCFCGLAGTCGLCGERKAQCAAGSSSRPPAPASAVERRPAAKRRGRRQTFSRVQADLSTGEGGIKRDVKSTRRYGPPQATVDRHAPVQPFWHAPPSYGSANQKLWKVVVRSADKRLVRGANHDTLCCVGPELVHSTAANYGFIVRTTSCSTRPTSTYCAPPAFVQ